MRRWQMEDMFLRGFPCSRYCDPVDRYMALIGGWPYDVAEEGGDTFARYAVDKHLQPGKEEL